MIRISTFIRNPDPLCNIEIIFLNDNIFLRMKKSNINPKIIKSKKTEASQLVTVSLFNEGLTQLMTDISDLFYPKFAKIDIRLERLENGQDQILKELVDMRDENTASTFHFDRNDQTLKDHEKRLKRLELAKN